VYEIAVTVSTPLSVRTGKCVVVLFGASKLVSYWLIRHLLPPVNQASKFDDMQNLYSGVNAIEDRWDI
jgi:hypothetical protein